MAMQSEAIIRAIETAGGVAALARVAGVKPQAISQWTVVPLARVKAIENGLGIPRHELRPDLWDPPAHDVGATPLTQGKAA